MFATTPLPITRQQVIGSIVGLIIIIAVAVGVGVAVSKSHHNSNKSASGNSSNSNNNSNGNSTVTQTNPNDPSTFVKDPNLKHSFYGIAYTPEGSQLPNCGNNIRTLHDRHFVRRFLIRVFVQSKSSRTSSSSPSSLL